MSQLMFPWCFIYTNSYVLLDFAFSFFKHKFGIRILRRWHLNNICKDIIDDKLISSFPECVLLRSCEHLLYFDHKLSSHFLNLLRTHIVSRLARTKERVHVSSWSNLWKRGERRQLLLLLSKALDVQLCLMQSRLVGSFLSLFNVLN